MSVEIPEESRNVNRRPKNPGPLWHMTVEQLKSILKCAGIPIPEKGTGTRGGHTVVKDDLVRLIRKELYGERGGKLVHEKTKGCDKKDEKRDPKCPPEGLVEEKEGLFEKVIARRRGRPSGPSIPKGSVVVVKEEVVAAAAAASPTGPKPMSIVTDAPLDADGDVRMNPFGGGGGSRRTAEEFFDTKFSPANCISGMGFREQKKIDFPHMDRLSHSVISFEGPIAVWQGMMNNTIIGQRLGKDKEYVNMWEWGLKGSFIPVTKWVDEETHIILEPIRIRAKSVCKGDDGNYYGFTMFSGKWFVSLEKLFKALGGNTSFPVMSSLSLVMSKVLSLSDRINRGGRDTQHYAWRFSKTTKDFAKTKKDRNTWLTIGLLPLPYIPHDKSPYKLVPVDTLLRSASRGIGGMFSNKMITK